MYLNPTLSSRELVDPQGGSLEKEQKVAATGQFTLAVSPIPGHVLVSAGGILLLLPLCSRCIPILILGSSHSCFISEGRNYIPGRPGRTYALQLSLLACQKNLKKIKNEKNVEKGRKHEACQPGSKQQLVPASTDTGAMS